MRRGLGADPPLARYGQTGDIQYGSRWQPVHQPRLHRRAQRTRRSSVMASMDGRGTLHGQHLRSSASWRSLKYEAVYLHGAHLDVASTPNGVDRRVDRLSHNTERAPFDPSTVKLPRQKLPTGLGQPVDMMDKDLAPCAHIRPSLAQVNSSRPADKKDFGSMDQDNVNTSLKLALPNCTNKVPIHSQSTSLRHRAPWNYCSAG